MSVRFDGRVAIVTGAGGGLGRAYALELASRGAKVLVNDLGGSVSGGAPVAGEQRPADKVVQEIRKAGGTAVANYDSVEFGDKIVKAAERTFGTVHIVINNAGILRDSSFKKMTELDWDHIMKVHLKGVFLVTKAAWNIMRANKYGRIVNIGSSAGIFGSFGQANYSTAKIGVWGFTQSLAMEGKKYNIKVNCAAPYAGTRMLATVMAPNLFDAIKPAYVAPFVALMCHESFKDSGALYEIGGGSIARLRWQRSAIVNLDLSNLSLEAVRNNWSKVGNFREEVTYPKHMRDFLSTFMAKLASQGKL